VAQSPLLLFWWPELILIEADHGKWIHCGYNNYLVWSWLSLLQGRSEDFVQRRGAETNGWLLWK
jgi:hypothetical protein